MGPRSALTRRHHTCNASTHASLVSRDPNRSVNAPVAPIAQDVEPLPEPARDPIDLGDDHGLDGAGEDVGLEPVERGPLHRPARFDVRVPRRPIRVDAVTLQPPGDGLALGVELLVLAADSDVDGDGGGGPLRLRHGGGHGVWGPDHPAAPITLSQLEYTRLTYYHTLTQYLRDSIPGSWDHSVAGLYRPGHCIRSCLVPDRGLAFSAAAQSSAAVPPRTIALATQIRSAQ